MTDEEAFEAWLKTEHGQNVWAADRPELLDVLGMEIHSRQFAEYAFCAGRASAAPPEPEGETVEVRVAVAVSNAGIWSAFGSSSHGDESARSIAMFDLPAKGLSLPYTLTARLPIPREPEPVVVAAQAEAGE